MLTAGTASAQVPASSTIKGLVVDARTGSPLPRVLVALEAGPSIETAQNGTFLLEQLPAGPIRMSVSTVGYGLVQRVLQLLPGAVLELRIPLSEGTAAYTESVTVTADRFQRPELVPAQQILGSAELQSLRGVLTDDALRAVQVLPGVATGDDFRSEFSVRGSDFSHLNFTVDGFATPFVMHMVRAVEERANTGSVSMINSDVLESVSLSNGGYPQRSGNRTGAELGFVVREGSRDRTFVRASVSGTSASMTVEGPLGGKRGSWLVSGRKSFLDLIVRKLREEGLSFGFADAQAKLRYDVGTSHSAALTFLVGKSRLRELPQQVEDSDLFTGDNASAIAIGSWRTAFRRGVFTAGVLGATNRFRNHILTGIDREKGGNDQVVARSDLALRLAARISVESGVLVEHVNESQRKQRISGTTVTVLNDYRADAWRQGAYARVRFDVGSRLTLSPGARVDHSSLTDQTTGSPWIQSELLLPGRFVIRAGGGVYQQFADFEEVVGAFGGSTLVPERSVHADLSVEHRLSPSTRVQVTLYHREDENVIRRPDADTRLVDGRVIRGDATAKYETRLEGYARGVELVLQRSAPQGFSGWLSYAFGQNHYTDRATRESYWGDLDQRHTLNAYVFYRFSHRSVPARNIEWAATFRFRATTHG
jgi:TonB dependent receptor/Carboxypeptidase regulatory-like domain